MTAASADPAPALLDTSTAIALLVEDHDHHESTVAALAGRPLGLAGQAAFETYSVLARLPTAARLVPRAAQRLLTANFPHTRFLGPERTAQLPASLADNGIAGGAVYDALVGATALGHDLPLVSRDRRAWDTYRTLGVPVDMLIRGRR